MTGGRDSAPRVGEGAQTASGRRYRENADAPHRL